MSRDDRYPARDPTFVPVSPDPDTVHFRAGPWTGSVTTVRDEEGDGVLGPLVRAFDGTASVTDLADRFGVPPAAVESVADELRRKGFVYDAGEPGESRASGLTDAGIDALGDRRVLVVATGGFARPAVADLASLGLEAVTVIPVDDGGWVPAGAEAAAPGELDDRLAAADVGLFLGDAPVPDLTAKLNERALAADTPVMYASAVGYDGVVGPFVEPGTTACYECFRRRAEQNVAAPELYREFERVVAASDNDPGPRLNSFGTVVAGLAVVDVCQWLVEGVGYSHGRVTHLNFDAVSMAVNDVLRLPRCDACGDRDTVGVTRHASVPELLSRRGGDD